MSVERESLRDVCCPSLNISLPFHTLNQQSLKNSSRISHVYLCGSLRNLKVSTFSFQVGITASLCLADSPISSTGRWLGGCPGLGAKDSCGSSPAKQLCSSRKVSALLGTKVFIVLRGQPFPVMDQKVNISGFPGHMWSPLSILLWFHLFVITLEKYKNHS